MGRGGVLRFLLGGDRALLLFRGLEGGLLLGLLLGLVQRFLDEPQHEIPLGELVASTGGLPLQVSLDALEKLLVDLEGQGSGFAIRHDFISSIFFHFEVFGQQVGDVLGGGQPRLLSGFRDFLVQVDWYLSTKIFCGWHGLFSFRLIVKPV